MKKASTLKSQSGFSLVELMVVVAIIGVLAAMSVGQVQRQIAKARQSESKTNLSTLYTSLEAFRAEWNSYTTDFRAAKLAYNGKLYYHVGFNTNHVPSLSVTGYTGSNSTAAFSTVGANAAMTCTSCVFMTGAGTPTGTSASAGAFNARAQGVPMAGGPNDIWEISESKIMTNTDPGI